MRSARGVLTILALAAGLLMSMVPTAGAALFTPVPRHLAGLSTGCRGLRPLGLSGTAVARVQARAEAMARGHLLSLAPCPGGPVLVGLRAGSGPAARRLVRTFGKRVAITVGLTVWTGRAARSPRCRAIPPPAPLPVGLHLALHLDRHAVAPGGTFGGQLVIAESGPGHYSTDTGQPLTAWVVRPGTRQVVAVYAQAIGGTGLLVTLAPGQSKAVRVVGGTARCDGGAGSALPAGRYQAVVQVAAEGPGPSPAYLTPPVPLRVAGP